MRYERELDGVMRSSSERRKKLGMLMKRRKTIRECLGCVVVAALLVLVAGVTALATK
jgi:hypothetical protein